MRRGIAIFLVLAVLLFLGILAGIATLLSSSGSREVAVLQSHLRAVEIGESGFAEILARLTAAPWSKRWFRGGPDARAEVPVSDGRYAYVIQDAPAAGPGAGVDQADLLVRATWGSSRVLMFWRVTIQEDSLETFRRAIPVFFTFPPDTVTPDPRGLSSFIPQVNDMVRARAANLPGFERTWPVDPPADANVGALIGVTPDGPIYDPPEGAGPVPPPPTLPPPIASPPPAADPGTLCYAQYYGSNASPPPCINLGGVVNGNTTGFILGQNQLSNADNQIHWRITLPDPASITKVSIAITSYNGDNTLEHTTWMSIDGQGGYLDVTKRAAGAYTGRGVLTFASSNSYAEDLSAVNVADESNIPNSSSLNLLDLARKPGGFDLSAYVSATQRLGPNSTVSVSLKITR